MSQHDFNIANQTFPSFRSDLNNALQAAATISAGASAPTTPYPYQLWYDTANEKYKIRNAANSAWIDVFGLDASGNITIAADLSVDGGTIKLDGNYPVGTGNVALGDAALDDGSLSGGQNTAIGSSALGRNAAGERNTALGFTAGANSVSGNYNVYLGSYCADSATGSSNVAVGDVALRACSGSRNVAVGADCMNATTSGSDNVAVGYTTLDANLSGNYNVAIGGVALGAGVTASTNAAIGYSALSSNTAASYNTAVGFESGKSLNTTGSTFNTFVGMQSGFNCTVGSKNTYVGSGGTGYGAGYFMTTGSANTILGAYNGNQGGLDLRTASNNIVLSDGDGNPRGFFNGDSGFKVVGNAGADGLSSKTDGLHEIINNQGSVSYSLRIASTSSSGNCFPLSVKFSGQDPNNASSRFITCQDTSTNRFEVLSNGNVINVNNSYGAISDVKLKENIIDASSQWDDIKNLTVRKYSMKADSLDAPNMLGVIAQEVEAAGMGGLVYESPDQDAEMNNLGTVTKQVNYSILYMKAVKALQEAMERIETLEAKVAALEAN